MQFQAQIFPPEFREEIYLKKKFRKEPHCFMDVLTLNWKHKMLSIVIRIVL